MDRTGSIKNKIVSPDLVAERANCDFDQEELRTWLTGGPESYAETKRIVERFNNDPRTRNHMEFYEMTPQEGQEDLWKRQKVVFENWGGELFKDLDILKYPYNKWENYFQAPLPGFGLHVSMYWLSVANLANEEQKAFWMPQIRQVNHLGCYAQTELGHGSNVAALETTATLDKTTDEFVVHSPTITSAKYWPGDLGRMSSHAIVFARLIIDGKDYGVQPFIVELRDVNTWKLRPGVSTGDIGPKFGYQTKDNGYAMFNQVRIPRTHMLMGLCNVTKDGEISFKGDPRVLYSVMMYIRMLIVRSCGEGTMWGNCIAMRYLAVRRQFATQAGTPEERTILNYQTTQHIFGPLLARGISMQIVASWTIDEFRKMMDDIKQSNFSRMDTMHHVLSGLKALFSESLVVNIDQARRACGGAGFSSNSGFTQLYANSSPIPTYEGDNTVMLGQAVRYLVKLWKKVKQNQKLPFPFEYLNNMADTLSRKNRAQTVQDCLDINILDQALQAQAVHLINTTMTSYNASAEPEKVKDNETFQQAKITMIKAHMFYLVFNVYRTKIEEIPFKDVRIKDHLKLLGKILALDHLLNGGAVVFDSGFFATGSYANLQQAMSICIKELRPQMIPLVESIYFPDEMVPSVLGNSYGDIYEYQMEMAKKSRVNKHNADNIPPYFDRLMKPVLRGKL